MGKLDGRTAVITGGSSGMALATAELLVAEGAFVVITGRDRDRLDEATARLEAQAPGQVQGVVCDSGDLGDLDRLMATVRESRGGIDVLFASAGAWSSAPIAEVTEEDYRSTFDVTVRGTLFTVQAALSLMPDGASIVLNGSTASVRALPGGTVYSASKAAVRSFARTWAAELGDRRIRVNVVSPGPIDTPVYRDLPDEERAERSKRIPRGEFGRPEEIASTVLFLACEDSSNVYGSELFVDGGMTQI